jgi:hypothetical protein
MGPASENLHKSGHSCNAAIITFFCYSMTSSARAGSMGGTRAPGRSEPVKVPKCQESDAAGLLHSCRPTTADHTRGLLKMRLAGGICPSQTDWDLRLGLPLPNLLKHLAATDRARPGIFGAVEDWPKRADTGKPCRRCRPPYKLCIAIARVNDSRQCGSARPE